MQDGYIIVEGTLTEGGTFSLLRSTEARQAELPARFADAAPPGGRTVEAVLLDRDMAPLTRASSALHFPTGCQGHGQFQGVGLVRAALADHPKARRMELYYDGTKVLSESVSPRPPEVVIKSFKVSKGQARITLEGCASCDIKIWAALKDGRRLRPRSTRAKDTWSVDLGTLAGFAEATLVVEAVAGFRSAEVSCGAVALPPSDVSAWIVEPEDGATLPFGKRISLIATLCDQNGRPMDWCDTSYTWRLDGKPLSRTSPQMMAWRADDPGTHRIDLIAGGTKAKRPKILASASVHVAQMTDAQAEFFDLIKARNALSAQNDGGTSP